MKRYAIFNAKNSSLLLMKLIVSIRVLRDLTKRHERACLKKYLLAIIATFLDANNLFGFTRRCGLCAAERVALLKRRVKQERWTGRDSAEDFFAMRSQNVSKERAGEEKNGAWKMQGSGGCKVSDAREKNETRGQARENEERARGKEERKEKRSQSRRRTSRTLVSSVISLFSLVVLFLAPASSSFLFSLRRPGASSIRVFLVLFTIRVLLRSFFPRSRVFSVPPNSTLFAPSLSGPSSRRPHPSLFSRIVVLPLSSLFSLSLFLVLYLAFLLALTISFLALSCSSDERSTISPSWSSVSHASTTPISRHGTSSQSAGDS